MVAALFTTLQRCHGIKEVDWLPPAAGITTDACLLGGSGFYGLECFHMVFPEHITALKLHISALELFTIVIAAKAWGHLWSGIKLSVACDNQAAVTVINTGKCKDNFMLSCVRELLFLAAKQNLDIKAMHIPGSHNELADCLSRWSCDPKYPKRFTELTVSHPMQDISIHDSYFAFIHDW